VGIGKIPGSYQLDVSGNINATNAVYANSVQLTSDYRIKANVRDIEYTVDNIRPVMYYNKLLNREDIGFIAHEVKQHIPLLVHGNTDSIDEHNGELLLQTVNYNGFIPILIKEIQELKKQIKIISEMCEKK
jgi:hypothetical protein